ncbi:YSIRK signal domain/LPXTG anchor domain surface protein, partial [Limosilactobacillus sp. c9Ua_26_M]|nr:YSIRK signal domain/LPXTG anchor domain surface protein [Limosilactobacillus urinaemulieris]
RLVRTLGATSGQYTVYQYITTFVYTKDTDPTDPKTPETTTTDPKTPSDKLPDNSGKNYPKGVDTTDLNKTITPGVALIPTNGGQPTTNDHQGQGTPATNTPTNTTPNGNAVTGKRKLEGNVPNMYTVKTITFQPTTAKDNQLPQTGNDNSLHTTVAWIIVSLLTSCLAVLGINKHQG